MSKKSAFASVASDRSAQAEENRNAFLNAMKAKRDQKVPAVNKKADVDATVKVTKGNVTKTVEPKETRIKLSRSVNADVFKSDRGIPENMDSEVSELLKKISLTHEPESMNLPIDKVVVNPDNPRTPIAFKPAQLIGLKKSMDEWGWMKGFPAFVNYDSRSKTYMLMIGHRRLATAKLCGIKTVPCIVYRDLTRAQMLRFVMDHRQTKGLTDAEILNSFITLVTNGFTRNSICLIMDWINPKDGKINNNEYDKYARLSILPEADREDWMRAKTDGKEAKGLDWKPTTPNINTLASAIKADRQAGCFIVTEGPKYKAAREEMKKGSSDIKPKSFYTRNDIKDLAQKHNSRWAIVGLLNRLCGNTEDDLVSYLRVITYALDQTFGLPTKCAAVTLAELKHMFPERFKKSK